jgi:hypothetical protein
MKWFKIHSPEGLDFTWGGDAKVADSVTELLNPDGTKLLEVPSEWVRPIGKDESEVLTRGVCL